MQVLYRGLIQTTPGLNPRPSLLQGVTPSTLCVCPRHGAGDGLLHPAGRVFLRPVAQRLLRFGSPVSKPLVGISTHQDLFQCLRDLAGLAPVCKRRSPKLLLLLGSPWACRDGRVVAVAWLPKRGASKAESTSHGHLQPTLEGLEGKLSSEEALEGISVCLEDRALPGDCCTARRCLTSPSSSQAWQGPGNRTRDV